MRRFVGYHDTSPHGRFICLWYWSFKGVFTRLSNQMGRTSGVVSPPRRIHGFLRFPYSIESKVLPHEKASAFFAFSSGVLKRLNKYKQKTYPHSNMHSMLRPKRLLTLASCCFISFASVENRSIVHGRFSLAKQTNREDRGWMWSIMI